MQRAVLDTRLAVQRALRRWLRADPGAEHGRRLVLVALSGGADSLALAAAAAYEAGRAGLRAGAVVVDHGLQHGSAEVAARAAEQGRALGLDPVLVSRVRVEAGGGPEAAAREARYAAFAEAVEATEAAAILTAHTRDDQAEQVLLALARGSGLRSLAGIPQCRPLDPASSAREERALILRPFLGEAPVITRTATEAACAEQGLHPWTDPHNVDRSYARVRARETVLPVIERELGPGVAEALARTADLAREDADALDTLAERVAAERVVFDEGRSAEIPIQILSELPSALRGRVIRIIAARGFGAHLSREHTGAVARLVTAWRGQGSIDVPGASVTRRNGLLVFTARRRAG